VAIAGWNVAWAVLSYQFAVRRYHQTPPYRALHARLALAPLNSALAPSPSLPLATLVAAFIAILGGLLMTRALADLARPAAAAMLSTGVLAGDRFVDGAHNLSLALPAGGWSFQPGRPPALLTGRRGEPRRTFSLAVAARPLFVADDVVPSGALQRFASRQEAELAATLDEFRVAGRRPLARPSSPGLRLQFFAVVAGEPTRMVQDYLLDRDRILILTLAGPAGASEIELGDEMDRIAAGLETTP
jgi:hypothetical protein